MLVALDILEQEEAIAMVGNAAMRREGGSFGTSPFHHCLSGRRRPEDHVHSKCRNNVLHVFVQDCQRYLNFMRKMEWEGIRPVFGQFVKIVLVVRPTDESLNSNNKIAQTFHPLLSFGVCKPCSV